VPIAGILIETLSDAAAVVVAVTGIFGGSSRYAAVLAGWDKDKVERATANGFFFGLCLAVLCGLVDFLA
jgi:hypothetical protein